MFLSYIPNQMKQNIVLGFVTVLEKPGAHTVNNSAGMIFQKSNNADFGV